jgi:tetratricopeptide (TPR) repeat protein
MSKMARNKVKNLLLLKQIHTAVSQIKKGKLDKALETLDKAENAARKAKSSDALYYVLFTRGGILYSAAKYDDALETYEKALVAGEELLKIDPESADYQHYMGTTLSNTGNLLKKKGENTRASEFYSRAREIYISLMAQDPKNVIFRSYAGENLNSYAVFLAETSALEEAGRIQKEAIEIYEKLLEENPENPGYQAELAVALSNLGSCYLQQSPENNDATKQNLERALTMQQNLLSQQPENEKIKGEIELTRKRLEGIGKT